MVLPTLSPQDDFRGQMVAIPAHRKHHRDRNGKVTSDQVQLVAHYPIKAMLYRLFIPIMRRRK